MGATPSSSGGHQDRSGDRSWTMWAPVLLSLLCCLGAPSGARILGRCTVARLLQERGLAYFESKFNPSAVYEDVQEGVTGFGLFQIRDRERSLLNLNPKDTIKCAKKIVRGKYGLGAWPSWSLHCRFSDTLVRWLDGCKL
ncbi:lysozyme-like protein 4 isoform X2 [Fukomys damarensis]|uniref:lysozyme-like protein 4 isoform X2 n=1 Tax=Fukomys damarensis TaxID=885580 RepID=UPI0008FECD30|nr:lysozyme-like protein 4 isoform X2 [Fukomys damarensis]